MSTPDRSIDPRLFASAEAEFLKHGFSKAELKTICENAAIERSAIDFSALSDDEVYMIPVFRLICDKHDKFILLIVRAAGTRYENFSHENITVGDERK